MHELWRGRRPLLSHLLLQSLLVAGTVWFAMSYLGEPWNTALLAALALLTPSTGFILEALPALGLDADERFWVCIKAVGGEILALGIAFVVLQSGSTTTLAMSALAIVSMGVGFPLLLRLLLHVVVPYAPGAEFSLLVMVGLVAAYLTNQLGVNYLFGAFLAGFIARRLRSRLPKLASDENLSAVKLFASFFIPFYFFAAGMDLPATALTWRSLQIGLLLTGVVLPVRVALVWLQRRFIKGETAIGSLKVATALTPTLIFTLVLATILRDRYHLADSLYGGLLVYAGTSTLLPSLALTQRTEVVASSIV